MHLLLRSVASQRMHHICRWVASVLQFSLASSLMSWKLPPVSSPLQRSASRQYSGLLHQDSDEEVRARLLPAVLNLPLREDTAVAPQPDAMLL